MDAQEWQIERDQVFMMTVDALHPQESVLQPSAFEVIGKFLLYVSRQELALRGHHISDPGVVPVHNQV
jgi:hypothetical protein